MLDPVRDSGLCLLPELFPGLFPLLFLFFYFVSEIIKTRLGSAIERKLSKIDLSINTSVTQLSYSSTFQ